MAKKDKKQQKNSKTEEFKPLMVSTASSYEPGTNAGGVDENPTHFRRNRAATINRTDKYKNIDEGLIPFRYAKGTSNYSNITIRDAVILCQKAYYNFAIFRNTIDLMTEFSCSDIYFKEGSQKVEISFRHYLRRLIYLIYKINFSVNIIEVVMYLFIVLIQKLKMKISTKLPKHLD